MNRKALTALFATLAVGGCTLAPDYQQPESPVPATAGDNQRIAEELVLPGWEALFQDPQLQQLIRTALVATHGRRMEAAQRLGIGRNTITRKIQELGLDAADEG